jgi:hypothetical protein
VVLQGDKDDRREREASEPGNPDPAPAPLDRRSSVLGQGDPVLQILPVGHLPQRSLHRLGLTQALAAAGLVGFLQMSCQFVSDFFPVVGP